MGFKNKILLLLAVLLIGSGFVGCGASEEQDLIAPSVSQPGETAPPEGVQPDIHINVPPPTGGEQTAFSNATAQRFFEKRQQISSFSPPLQQQIQNNVGNLPDPVDPVDPNDPAAAGGPPVFYTMIGGTLPRPAFNGDCDPTTDFICVDAPQPPEGFDDIFTIEAGLDVVVRLDLNQLAVFGSADPVAVVSVFNNEGGNESEVLVMPEDVESTSETDIGKFQTAIALAGYGKFTVVISAYRVINPGQDTETNDLFSKSFNVFRTVAPELEIEEVRPVINGTPPVEKEPVEDGEVIAADLLRVKARLTSPFSPGVQVRFENFDEGGYRRSFDVVGFTSSKQAQNEEIYTGQLVLHQGLNEIQIVGTNPELDHALGPNAPEPQILTFKVYNYFGAPKIKILEPLPEQPLITQNFAEGQKVQVQFCYTLVPDKIETGLGGTQPTDSDECVTGSLGFEPRFFLNGRRIGGDEDNPNNDALDYNGAQGVFTAQVTPDFGINLYEIQVVDGKDSSGNDRIISSDVGSFNFGVPVNLFEEGNVAEENTFTPRGLNLDIDQAMIEGDIKDLIVKFLNRPETKDLILGIFKSTARKPGYTCDEYIDPNTGKPVQSNGDTSIEFLTDTFTLGPVDGDGPAIELTHLAAGSSGMLELGVVLHGMHGEADLKPVQKTGNTFNGMDLGFLPITFALDRLEMNIGVAFPLDSKAIDSDGDGIEDTRRLDIRPLPGKDLFKIVGDGPLGKAIYINSSRNPLAAGLELLDWQSNLLSNTFNAIMGGTLLCGIEEGQNNTLSGAIGKAVVDLPDLQSKAKNLFRLNLNQEVLGKPLQLDVAVDALKGEIAFDEEGIHLRNVPIRVNPAPNLLTSLLSQFETGMVGALSRFPLIGEEPPQENITNGIHKVGLEISEDVVNQALFTANLLGLLNLDVDAAFYAQNGIVPSARLLPQGDMFLTQGMDINMNGDTTDDATIPVMMRVRTDPRRPPMLTYLSTEEVQSLVKKEQEMIDNQAAPEGDGMSQEPKRNFDSNHRYFRFAVSGLELSVFEQQPNPGAGAIEYCNVPLPTDGNASLEAKGYCGVPADAKALVPLSQLKDGTGCPEGDIVSVPQGNGAVISRPVKNPNYQGDPVPLYRVRVGLVLYGDLQGINREVPAKDRVVLEDPKVKNIFRAKLVPSFGLPEAHLVEVEVLENHTEQPDAQIVRNLNDFLNAAVGTDCSLFNELKVPVPASFEFDTEKEGLIQDLGLTGLDLGTTLDEFPEIYIDDNRLFLDVLLFADLQFEGEDA